MKTLLQLTFIFPFVSPEINIIQQLKRFVCETSHLSIVFYELHLSVPVESSMNQYLMDSDDHRKIITSNNSFSLYHVPQQSCLLMFLSCSIEMSEFLFFSHHRKLIVTSSASFEMLKSQFKDRNILNAVYLTLTGSHYTIYHYNEYLGKLERFTQLETSQSIESTLDVSGYGITATFAEQIELEFTNFVLAKINGTLLQSYARFAIYFDNSDILSDVIFFQYFYLHRTARYRFLVPRVSKLKSMFSMLIDPFDLETWIGIALTIMATAFFRMICSGIHSFQQYLRNLLDVLTCVVWGDALVFHRLSDRIIAGLLELMNVILSTAYGSLVISFLLNPRFHPELDTIGQLNESCCLPAPEF